MELNVCGSPSSQSKNKDERECNVFGSPITNSTLRSKMGYTGKKITREDRVREALASKDNEYTNARNYLESLIHKRQYWLSRMRCLLYNATGGPIILVSCRDWHGQIFGFPLPLLIENGQWAAFLHVQGSGEGSDVDCCSGAIVYRSIYGSSFQYQWCVAWFAASTNKAYCEVGDLVKYDEGQWKRVRASLHKSGLQHSCNMKEIYSVVSVSNGTVSILEALLTETPMS